MTKEYALRRGDGKRLMMIKSQIIDEIQEGVNDVADLGSIPVLNGDDMERLAEILMMSGRMVGVEAGMEVPVTHDIEALRIDGGQSNSGIGIPSSCLVGMMFYECAMGSISVVRKNMIVPILYGAMPNMGMSAGGIPMFEAPIIDAVSHASKATVELASVDSI